MRIVNLDQFLALPPGTIYFKYVPCMLTEMSVKRASLRETRDWFRTGIESLVDGADSQAEVDAMLAMEKGASVPARYDSYGRDSCYEPDQKFLVLDEADRKEMIRFLMGGIQE